VLDLTGMVKLSPLSLSK